MSRGVANLIDKSPLLRYNNKVCFVKTALFIRIRKEPEYDFRKNNQPRRRKGAGK